MSTNKRVKETFDKLGKDLVITKQSCDTKKMLKDIKNKVEIKKAVGEIIDTLINRISCFKSVKISTDYNRKKNI